MLFRSLGGNAASAFVTKAGDTMTGSLTVNGNVGVGAASQGEKLEVTGKLKLLGTGNGIIFPDGSTQTTACGFLFSPNGRPGRPDSVAPAGGRGDGNASECSAAASLQQVVQDQRVQLQRLQAEIESLKQRLDAIAGARR